jgi:hypothetical protein
VPDCARGSRRGSIEERDQMNTRTIAIAALVLVVIVILLLVF